MDIHVLIRSLSVEQIINIVEELGSEVYTITDEVVQFSTQYRGGDSVNKLWFYCDSHMFVDYTGEGQRSLVDLVMDALSLDFGEACRWIENKVGGRRGVWKREEREEEVEEVDDYEFKIDVLEEKKDVLRFYWDVAVGPWLEEGITEDVMKEFEIKWNWVDSSAIIPCRDYNGRLIGIRQRNFEEGATAKYCPTWLAGEMFNYPTGEYMYGLYQNKEEIERTGTVYLVEGEKSVLKAASWGIRNVLALSGLQLSRWQIDMLQAMGVKKVVFVLDRDYLTDDGSLGYQNYIKRKKKLYDKARQNFPVVYFKQDIMIKNAHDNLFDVGKYEFVTSKEVRVRG